MDEMRINMHYVHVWNCQKNQFKVKNKLVTMKIMYEEDNIPLYIIIEINRTSSNVFYLIILDIQDWKRLKKGVLLFATIKNYYFNY